MANKLTIYERTMHYKWTFLDKKNLFGGLFKGKIIFSKAPNDIFVKIGTQAVVTDFSIALGADLDNSTLNSSENIKDRTGFYWIWDYDGAFNIYKRVITPSGKNNYTLDTDYAARCVLGICCRPTFSSKYILPLSSNINTDSYGITRCEYGSYPQDAVSAEESKLLENLFNSNKLNQSKRQFNINKLSRQKGYDKNGSTHYFELDKVDEFEYNGRTFTRVIAKKDCVLSNGISCKEGDPIWIEIKPITWIIDKKNNLIFTEKLIFSGIPLTDGLEKNNIINKFFTDFSQQIISQKEITKYANMNSKTEEIEKEKIK